MFVDEVGMTASTPPPPARSLKLGVASQPRSSPVQLPAYLQKTARPGATPNTKVAYLYHLLYFVLMDPRRHNWRGYEGCLLVFKNITANAAETMATLPKYKSSITQNDSYNKVQALES